MPKRKYARGSYRCVLDAFESAYSAGGENRLVRLLQAGMDDVEWGSYLSKRQGQFLSYAPSLAQLKAALGTGTAQEFELWKHGATAAAVGCRPKYIDETKKYTGENKIFRAAPEVIAAGEPAANYKTLVPDHLAASKIVMWSLMSAAQKDEVRAKLKLDNTTATNPKDRFDAEVVLETIGE